MNLFLLGIIIFVVIYLFLNWFAGASSKKIATTIKKIAIYISLILAVLFTIGGKFIFSLPMWLILLSGLKIKGFTALQMYQWQRVDYVWTTNRCPAAPRFASQLSDCCPHFSARCSDALQDGLRDDGVSHDNIPCGKKPRASVQAL